MGKFKIKLQVIDPAPVLERRIKEVIANKINSSIKIFISRIKPRLRPLIEKAIFDSPEYASLKGGQLQAEFGVKSSQVDDTINYIIDRLVDTINVDFKPMNIFGGRQKARLTLSIFPNNIINDLINYSASKYKTKRGTDIPWLKWLLTLGDKIIVRNYIVSYQTSNKSRTGLAVMEKVRGQGWRVPPQFSGTRKVNFITRAFDNIANFIEFTFQDEFLKSLK